MRKNQACNITTAKQHNQILPLTKRLFISLEIPLLSWMDILIFSKGEIQKKEKKGSTKPDIM